MGLIDIGNGLSVGLKKSNVWYVSAKNGCYDLIEMMDFFRVIILLERSYTDVKLLFLDYTTSGNSSEVFPLWKIIGAGLLCKSDEWASLALKWFVNLKQSEKKMLVDQLLDVSQSKWASQKSRQLAKKYLGQITDVPGNRED